MNLTPEASVESPLRILCASWNVNSSHPGLDSLSSWLCPSTSKMNIPPHVVAVSLQEVIDLKDLKHYVNEDETRNLVQLWGETIVDTLKAHYPSISFVMLKRAFMVGIALIVIVQTPLIRRLRDVKKNRLATGTFGVLGNKGGCAIRFIYLDPTGNATTFCFLGLHLTAHQHEVVKRTQDFEYVINKLDFNSDTNNLNQKRGSMPKIVVGYEDSLIPKVNEHDVVFALGDMNYRIDNEDLIYVLDTIRRKELAPLLAKDQLLNEIRTNPVFQGYEECVITFPPTYKFQPGTSKYDTRNEKKKRIPAWCDRILYRTNKNIECLRYRACPNLISSDHKPISGLFIFPKLSVSLSTLSKNASTASSSSSLINARRLFS